jgi:hypothetical protein
MYTQTQPAGSKKALIKKKGRLVRSQHQHVVTIGLSSLPIHTRRAAL